MSVVVCRPTFTGLGEAATERCRPCGGVLRRHWLFVTIDPYYDPRYSWRCDTCGTACPRPLTPVPHRPLLWPHALRMTMERAE